MGLTTPVNDNTKQMVDHANKSKTLKAVSCFVPGILVGIESI